MKQKLCYLLFILLLGGMTISAKAQSFSFNITKWSGENQNVALQSINKVTFSEDDLILNYVSNETENVDMLSIRRITFYVTTTGIQNPDKYKEVISVFPNPASNSYISLQNLPVGKHEIQIFSSLGMLILQTEIMSGSSLDVGNLTTGMYFIKIGNQTIKFIKQ